MNFKILSLLVGLLTYTNSYATAVNIDGSVDLRAGCASQIGTTKCEIKESGISLKLSCSDSLYQYDYGVGCYNTGTLTITANAPFNITGANNVTVTMKDKFNATLTGNYGIVSSIKFLFGVTDGLTESLQAANGILFASYTNAFNAANMFKGEIAKTHRGHMTRFMSALTEGMQLLDSNNKDKVSIVDWRVQENARLIVVFGTIMNELLTDYDDVERLKIAINTLNSLVNQLRVSYGWERGLAGTASKASAALLQVLRLEVQELASIKMAMGESNLSAYTNLLRTSGTLLAKVNGSKSGDMKAQREIYDLVDAWNSTEFQAELTSMLNAGPDFKNLVLPKLTMLLKSVESINDLADAGLIIPNSAATVTTVTTATKAKTKTK